MPQPEPSDFPIIACGEAGVTDDGQAVLVQLFTVGGLAIHFSVKRIDLEKIVTLLLRTAANFGPGHAVEDRVQYQPIPVTGMSAGELADGSGCVGVTVGSTELMFQLPLGRLAEIGQTLLTVGGAPTDPRRMS
jgi:hypothetical protein